MKGEGLEISQPALDPNLTKMHRITVRARTKKFPSTTFPPIIPSAPSPSSASAPAPPPASSSSTTPPPPCPPPPLLGFVGSPKTRRFDDSLSESKLESLPMDLLTLQHIRQIAQESSGEIQYGGGHQLAVLRTFSHRLCRGFNDVVNGFVDDGWSLMGWKM
ncbi:hypothetical protein AAZV13_10G095900 [Glycine max]